VEAVPKCVETLRHREGHVVEEQHVEAVGVLLAVGQLDSERLKRRAYRGLSVGTPTQVVQPDVDS
jgi:hypothetical protein